MDRRNPLWGHLAALGTICVWGVTFINIKVLLEAFTPVEIMAFRLALAVAALWLVRPPRGWARQPIGDWLRGEWKVMAAGLCGVTLYFLFQNLALAHTLAANVSVLVSVAPLFTALTSRLFLDEKLKANFLLGFIVAMAGIVLIAFNGQLVLKLSPLGDLLSVLAALAWAFYSVLVKQAAAREADVLRLTRKVFTYGLLFTLPALPLFGFRLEAERLVVPANLLNLLFLGVGASALCFVTWNYALQRLGPVKTSVYIYLGPVVTIIAALLVLGERITPVAAAGMALILAGMALSERGKAVEA